MDINPPSKELFLLALNFSGMALKLLELVAQGDDELTGDLGVSGLLMKKNTMYKLTTSTCMPSACSIAKCNFSFF